MWKQLSIVRVLGQLLPFLVPERRRLAVNVVITLALTGAAVATPLLFGMFIDGLVARLSGVVPTVPPPLSQSWIVGLLAFNALLNGVLIARQQALAGLIGERVAARIRNALWQHLQILPLDYTRRRGSGRLLVRFISDTRAVQRLVSQGLIQLAQDFVLVAVIIAVLAGFNWRLALIFTGVVPLYGGLFRWLNPKLRQASRQTRRQRSRLSAYVQERLTGMVIVKAFVQQPAETSQIQALNHKLERFGSRRAAITGQLQGATSASVALATLLVLVVASSEVTASRLTAGTLVTFYSFMLLVVPVLQRIVVANRYFQEAQISIDRLTSTLARQPESTSEEGCPTLVVHSGTIEFQHVTLQRGSARPIVEDICFTARRGEMVAVVGHNGSGKTTLLELLLRFRQPTDGHICIDDQDIANVSLASLRSRIGLVPQDAPLFDGTVANNIAYGLPNHVSRDQIEKATCDAGVTALIEALPEGWATRVGNQGRRLSGGQRQLIALARALALDPPILVLDEATSAIDAETEHDLARILRDLSRTKTVIITAHRLPMLRMADRIYVLEQGKVVETGNHTTLLHGDGAYARLFADDAAVNARSFVETS